MNNYTAFALLIFILTVSSCQSPPKESDSVVERKWWKEAIVYQVYPRSFKDSNGDGIGDLKGIISKLDYISSLGVDVVWLNPIYTSPNYDNGYDISDYRNIMSEFGTMEDFDNLLKGLHERNIKLLMDLVVNHSSSEHEWFRQSRSSRGNAYRHYYHWWPAEKGKPTPRFSFFDIDGDAWEYDSLTDAYYLHYFAEQQPDLNWENPAVRKEIYDIMKFWADKGIDGFRLDAFQYASKDTTFGVLPSGYERNIAKYYGMRPQLHTYLQEMNKEVLSKYDVMSVAEGAGSSFEDAHALVDAERNELNMAYHFDAIDIGKEAGSYSLLDFKRVYSKWDSAFAENGWLSIYLANHDNARMVSRFGNDSEEFREKSSKMLSTFIMTMRGTPYYYNGDELGMTNIRFDKIENYQDIETLNKFKKLKQNGGDLTEFMELQKRVARDNGRTPFQWDKTTNGGFSTGTPWLQVNPNHEVINADVQEGDQNSVLNYFRALVKLRKGNPVLVYGSYSLLDKENPDVYAYTRKQNGENILVLLNFKGTVSKVNTDLDLSRATVLLGNYPDPSIDGNLKPYESVIYKLN